MRFEAIRSCFALPCLLLLLLGACEINRYTSAEDHYNNKRYAAAIQELDNYIQKGNNGGIVTRSEILRAKCYYELGLLAMQRESWDLGIRFLKLSNSGEADQALGLLYRRLSDQALAAGDPVKSMLYVEGILREIPGSELTAEMLGRRISYLLDTMADYDGAWETYMQLYDNYPNNPHEVTSRKQILRLIPGKIDYARRLTETGYSTEGLRILFELSKYPVVDIEENNRLIAEAYIRQAESFLSGQNYLEADRFFRIAVQYDPAKIPEVNRRLEQVAALFIKRGDELLARREFDAALTHYQKTYEIIPNYAAADRAIERLNSLRASIKRAEELYAQAEKAELGGRFGEALGLYRQAYGLDPRPAYSNKAGQMQNMLDAQANPTAFARRIILEYRGGLLNSRIQKQKQELLQTFDPQEIRDSGWKVLISTGQYKYEVRYDLVTPTLSYYYVWQVNLKDRVITPLNKLSENLMR